MRERVRELAQESEGERGDICMHCVSGCVARQEAQQDGLEVGEGGNGCRQKPRQETPGMMLFLSYQKEALSKEIRVKNSQGTDSVPRAP